MRKSFAAVAAIGALAMASAANADVVINFDDLTGYAEIPTLYAGIDWQGNFVYYDDPQDPFNPSSGNTRIFGDYDDFPCCGVSSMAFKVGAGTIFNGAFLAGAGVGTVTFELYNGGSLVATSASAVTTSTPTFLSSGYAGAIDEVRIIADNGYWVADDLTFETLNGLTGGIPEPSTWALLIAGFGGAGAMLRRRRVASAA